MSSQHPLFRHAFWRSLWTYRRNADSEFHSSACWRLEGEEKEKVDAYKDGLEKNGKGRFMERQEEIAWVDECEGDLEDENARSEYESGYQKLVEFFGKFL